MESIIKDRDLCSGCHACSSVCPKQCIEMRPNNEGFLYPEINQELCINCGLCKKVCNIANERQTKDNSVVAYAVVSKNEVERQKSSSGGVFGLLCQEIIAQGGIVFGAGFSTNCEEVRHIGVDTNEQIGRLQGAKYVQSNINKTYLNVKENLETGRKVLFVGTPCQVDGLNAYLGGKYDGLIMVDFICHGVPSPKLWMKYLRQFTNGNETEIKVDFRNKKYGWKNYTFVIEKNKKVIYRKLHKEDPYLNAFIKNRTLRKSCYMCEHKTLDRKSDITLGDFWGIDSIAQDMNDDKGTSLILVHTDNGQELIEKISLNAKIKMVEVESAIKHNPSAIKSAIRPEERERIYEMIDSESLNIILKRYCKVSVVEKIKTRIKILFKL